MLVEILLNIIVWTLVIFAFGAGAFVLFNIVRLIAKIMYFKHEIKNADCVRRLPNKIGVEAEVLEIREKRLSRLDVQYTVKLAYSIGERFFYKDFVFLNRASLRAGAKMTLLCDSADPENAVMEDGSETESLRLLIHQIRINIFLIIISSIVCAMSILLDLGEIASHVKKH